MSAKQMTLDDVAICALKAGFNLENSDSSSTVLKQIEQIKNTDPLILRRCLGLTQGHRISFDGKRKAEYAEVLDVYKTIAIKELARISGTPAKGLICGHENHHHYLALMNFLEMLTEPLE